MNTKSKEDLELARQKVIAESDSNEAWLELQNTMYHYIHGRAERNNLESKFAQFKAAHNIDIGLRHEP